MTTQEPDDTDARFAEIIAGWDDEPAPEPRPGVPGRGGSPEPRTGVPGSRAAQGPTEEVGTRAASPQPIPPAGRPPQIPQPPSRTAPPAAPEARSFQVYRDPASGLSMGTDHRSWTPPDDPDDETFVPPPPAPMPDMGRDPGWWAILAGLVLGPLVLVLLVLTGHTTPRLYLWLAGLATAAAFVGLVLRLPGSDDDHDDGARV